MNLPFTCLGKVEINAVSPPLFHPGDLDDRSLVGATIRPLYEDYTWDTTFKFGQCTKVSQSSDASICSFLVEDLKGSVSSYVEVSFKFTSTSDFDAFCDFGNFRQVPAFHDHHLSSFSHPVLKIFLLVLIPAVAIARVLNIQSAWVLVSVVIIFQIIQTIQRYQREFNDLD
ncbi:hypothetical protein ONZ45_g16460 [Pleurotus djamor]|nr:hypothetical protein ONZ45_g16460 [Pleurotus djamor]